MYDNLKNIVTAENSEYLTKRIENIKTNENALRDNSTETRWAQYQAGQITKDQAIEYACIRSQKEFSKSLTKKFARLETIANAPEVKSVSISVVWTKNKTWGYNPTATVTIQTTNGYFHEEGHASGCGYDKQSAAVGEALNKSNAIIKMLCDKKETAVNDTNDFEYSNEKYIAYGAGYGAIPYFEGGVGMSSFERVFNECGFILKTRNETKTTNYYYFEKA